MSDLVRLPFPLRDEPRLDVVVQVPRDLTKDEASRLAAWLMSMAQSDTGGTNE